MARYLPFFMCMVLTLGVHAHAQSWTVDSQKEWEAAQGKTDGIGFKNGFAEPDAKQASFSSIVKTFDKIKKAKFITFKQSPVWDNWKKIKDITPPGLSNALVFLPVAPGEYYVFGEMKAKIKYPKGATADEKKAIKKKLKNNKYKKGYHVWRSSDLKNWEHGGQVTNSKWMTTAEYADGKFYLYYDAPNDEDPHLIVDENIMDGKVGKDYGKVLNDPSHGSDCAIFRDEDGTFHIIYEDWSPINAQTHSWDSPLAGHASSPDGIHGFEPHEHPFPVDHRTKPTGEIGTYRNGRQKYNIHKPEQDAYGDWTMIKIGTQYYLFCDYDPADRKKSMRMGRFTSDNLYKEFTWAGEIGEGFHPDPSVGFAEGKFYVIMQKESDFMSPGPWVDGVEARAGVDKDGDGTIDQWTKWQRVTESYSQKKGFARIVDVKPAQINLSPLPEGKGFGFEFKTTPLKNGVQPIMDRVVVDFE